MSKKLTHDYVKNYIESFGYKLIDTKYGGNKTKMNVVCPNNHVFVVKFNGFKSSNNRCPTCRNDEASLRCKIPYQILLEKSKTNNLTLLTSKEEYEKNNHKKGRIVLKCDNGHVYRTTASRIKSGTGCRNCKFIKVGTRSKKDYYDVKKVVEAMDYTLVSENYINNSTKLDLLCPKHGLFSMPLHGLLGGHRCRKCFSKGEKVQKEIFDFIQGLVKDCEENDRKQIKPFELDFYIPSLNLAIEYDGVWWHSEKFQKYNDYHINKMRLCNEKGIRLITIFEDEWIHRKEQVKSFLKSVLNKNSISIYARKTEIKQIDEKTAKIFLNEYHIQGGSKSKIAFGLYHENDLIAVITGNKHHRQVGKGIFVLNRLAFKNDISVVGGSSKLLKALLNYTKENGYSKLISWSDNRWSQGNVYEKLGFELTVTSPPDYSYATSQQKRFSKQSCTKKNLLKRGAVGTMENTETELAASLKLYRIWDCGKKRWEIDLTQI